MSSAEDLIQFTLLGVRKKKKKKSYTDVHKYSLSSKFCVCERRPLIEKRSMLIDFYLFYLEQQQQLCSFLASSSL